MIGNTKAVKTEINKDEFISTTEKDVKEDIITSQIKTDAECFVSNKANITEITDKSFTANMTRDEAYKCFWELYDERDTDTKPQVSDKSTNISIEEFYKKNPKLPNMCMEYTFENSDIINIDDYCYDTAYKLVYRKDGEEAFSENSITELQTKMESLGRHFDDKLIAKVLNNFLSKKAQQVNQFSLLIEKLRGIYKPKYGDLVSDFFPKLFCTPEDFYHQNLLRATVQPVLKNVLRVIKGMPIKPNKNMLALVGAKNKGKSEIGRMFTNSCSEILDLSNSDFAYSNGKDLEINDYIKRKLFVIVQEQAEMTNKEINYFKKVTGSTTISVRALYKGIQPNVPWLGLFIFNSNTGEMFKNDGLKERLLPVQVFPNDKNNRIPNAGMFADKNLDTEEKRNKHALLIFSQLLYEIEHQGEENVHPIFENLPTEFMDYANNLFDEYAGKDFTKFSNVQLTPVKKKQDVQQLIKAFLKSKKKGDIFYAEDVCKYLSSMGIDKKTSSIGKYLSKEECLKDDNGNISQRETNTTQRRTYYVLHSDVTD